MDITFDDADGDEKVYESLIGAYVESMSLADLIQHANGARGCGCCGDTMLAGTLFSIVLERVARLEGKPNHLGEGI